MTSRPRKILIAVAAVGVILVGFAAIKVLPVSGLVLPAGITRMHIITESPNLSFSCMAAALAPARVATSGNELILVSVASGETLNVVWPSGFTAWRVRGHSAVTDLWGSTVGRDGDVLDSLSGGLGTDDAFHICPFGIVTGR